MRLSNWCNLYTTVSPLPAKNAQYNQKHTKKKLKMLHVMFFFGLSATCAFKFILKLYLHVQFTKSNSMAMLCKIRSIW